MAKRKDISSGDADKDASSSKAASPEESKTANEAAAIESVTESKTESSESSETSEAAPPIVTIDPPSSDAEDSSDSKRDDDAPPASAPSPNRRFLQLAAAVAVAAALGAVLGSLGSAGIAHMTPQASMPASASPLASNTALAEETRALRRLVSRLTTDIATLKQSVAAANRGNDKQFAKLAERLDSAQTAPVAKLAKIGETLERLERRAAPETTGSISAPQRTPQTTRQAAPQTVPTPPERPAIVSGWVVREVFDGRALVENRDEIYEVGTGSKLPGLGRVKKISRQNGRWVVVTAKGMIVPGR